MNRLPHIAHSLAAASASARAIGRMARPASTSMPTFSRCYSSAFQHGLRPFPFGFTPVQRSSAPSSHAPEALVDHAQPSPTPVQVAQALSPELVDEIQLASALDTAAAMAMAASEQAAASATNTNTNPALFDSPTAALDSAAAVAAAESSDSAPGPNLSWFVDPAATDMLPLWQRNLLTSAADTAIAQRSTSLHSSSSSLDDLLLASDDQLTPHILSEFLARHGGQDVVVLDTADLSDVTDSIVIATAASPAHMVSLASRLHAFIKEQISALVANHEEREAAVAAISIEGMDCDDWILLDLGRVFVHVMTSEGRSEYDLDGLWGGKSMANNKEQAEGMVGGSTDWDRADELASRRMPIGPVVFDDEPQGVQLRL
ncbi:hypothetical protein BCR44DRAFT_34482 [Catenaria anguillulae PL171]|uniref:Oligomerization domain-domain-containing protein n=1 Tax=Catenaria anguillulae PL171 TaxID=765915 RepID=A0A1Y2I2U1_9FUNG|nr:hypothetical protein BCR44DRAFT_34482 [Catenaria anguillulae PL171]